MSMTILTEKRISFYCSAIIGLYVILCIVFVKNAFGPENVFNDFVQYRAAGILASSEKAQLVYDRTVLREVQRELAHEDSVDLRFSYPPIYLLFLEPLSMLPSSLAFVLFIVPPLGAFVFFAQKTANHPLGMKVALAFPGIILNINYGQNGFVSAALLGGALYLLETNPCLSAVLMGFLCYKPNIALICPFLLLFSKRFRELAVFTVTVLTLVLISIVLYGIETWGAFLGNLSAVFEAVKESPEILYRMGTLFASLKIAGVHDSTALRIHSVFMVVLLVLVCYLWYRFNASDLVKSITVSAAILMTPYLFEYDLILVGLSIAWFYRGATKTPLTHNEKSILFLCWLLPFISRHLATATNIGIAPIAVLMIMAIALQRLFRH